MTLGIYSNKGREGLGTSHREAMTALASAVKQVCWGKKKVLIQIWGHRTPPLKPLASVDSWGSQHSQGAVGIHFNPERKGKEDYLLGGYWPSRFLGVRTRHVGLQLWEWDSWMRLVLLVTYGYSTELLSTNKSFKLISLISNGRFWILCYLKEVHW